MEVRVEDLQVRSILTCALIGKWEGYASDSLAEKGVGPLLCSLVCSSCVLLLAGLAPAVVFSMLLGRRDFRATLQVFHSHHIFPESERSIPFAARSMYPKIKSHP